MKSCRSEKDFQSSLWTCWAAPVSHLLSRLRSCGLAAHRHWHALSLALPLTFLKKKTGTFVKVLFRRRVPDSDPVYVSLSLERMPLGAVLP